MPEIRHNPRINLPLLFLLSCFAILAGMPGTSSSGQTRKVYNPFSRDSFSGKKYVLFIFCKGMDDKRLNKQMSLLKMDFPKLTARGVLVMDEYEVSLTPEAQEDFMHYRVKKGAFMVVLADKSVKTLFTADKPVPSATILQALDQHPAPKHPPTRG